MRTNCLYKSSKECLLTPLNNNNNKKKKDRE